jgi:hypothetical protein
MPMLPRSTLALLLVLAAAPGAPSDRLPFAAPEVIVLNGGPLHRRVVLSDWAENQRLMLATGRNVPLFPDSLRQRPRINVAMYWGVQWRGRTDLPDSVAAGLIPNGLQPGVLYPAIHGKHAVWVFGGVGEARTSARMITSEGLQILTRRGVPVAVK